MNVRDIDVFHPCILGRLRFRFTNRFLFASDDKKEEYIKILRWTIQKALDDFHSNDIHSAIEGFEFELPYKDTQEL